MTEMTWIACSDRAPEERQLCLVYAKDWNWTEWHVVVAEWWHGPDNDRDGEWVNVCYDQNDWLSPDAVTHWMPFPDPPPL
jgi:hypothetical protein